MSLIFLILVVVAFVVLGIFTAQLARKVKAIDKDAEAAFARVGTDVGGLMVRLDRVEGQVGAWGTSQATEPTQDVGEDEIILFMSTDDDSWAPQGNGAWTRVIPKAFGTDVAEDYNPHNEFQQQLLPALPALENNGRRSPFGWTY